MRKIRYEFLLIAALIMTLGTVTAFADGKKGKKDDEGRVPKGMAQIKVTVTTDGVPYHVTVDGRDHDIEDADGRLRFNVTPDREHTIVVTPGDGTEPYTKRVTLIKGHRECICVKITPRKIETPCPYFVDVKASAYEVKEGESITFTAEDTLRSNVPLNYRWRVSAGTITSGMGTSMITVSTENVGDQTINVYLDVNDNEYHGICDQSPSANVHVTPPEKKRYATKCDEVQYRSHDDDKARMDNCVIQVQNEPGSQIYLIIYPGTAKGSPSYESISNRARQYLFSVRGLPQDRIQIVRGPSRDRTSYEVYVVPAGADPPVPQ